MKALELTVYEVDQSDPSMVVVDGFWEYRPYDTTKRFTDAELAAEIQSAVFHEAECEVRGLRLGMRNPDHPGIEHYSYWNHEFGRRAMILERFATLPHYDEAQEEDKA